MAIIRAAAAASPPFYRVTLAVEYYGWLDIDLGISPGWMAAIVH